MSNKEMYLGEGLNVTYLPGDDSILIEGNCGEVSLASENIDALLAFIAQHRAPSIKQISPSLNLREDIYFLFGQLQALAFFSNSLDAGQADLVENIIENYKDILERVLIGDR